MAHSNILGALSTVGNVLGVGKALYEASPRGQESAAAKTYSSRKEALNKRETDIRTALAGELTAEGKADLQSQLEKIKQNRVDLAKEFGDIAGYAEAQGYTPARAITRQIVNNDRMNGDFVQARKDFLEGKLTSEEIVDAFIKRQGGMQ